MPILPVYGHADVRERLTTAIAASALPASMLLQGPRGVGKQRLALWLGQALVCSGPQPPCGACEHCRYALDLRHPDVHWYYPRPRLKDSDPAPADVVEDYAEATAERLAAGGLYAPPEGTDGLFVATVRTIVRQAGISPALARRKVFVIGDAERMIAQEGADAAANAFLKLLEEPPADTTLILTSSEPGALLPTIRSRVVVVRLALLPDAEVARFVADPLVAKRLSAEVLRDAVRAAAGAPGVLLDDADGVAQSAARALLDAAAAPAAARYRVAITQKVSRARGGFSDALEALTVLVHQRAHDAVIRGDARMASGASCAVASVEKAKMYAAGNVNPQLIAADLIRELREALS